jgi:predicted hydrolase (HD superfamily)
MVAVALEGYAEKLGQDSELWYQTGLLHDIDYEKWPDEHPMIAVNELLVEYPPVLRQAVLSHGYGTVCGGHNATPPQNLLDRYITAVDELSGFLRAVAKVRPDGFATLEKKSVLKRLKNKTFAAAIDRGDITVGAEMIGVPLDEHIDFMIKVFREKLPQ